MKLMKNTVITQLAALLLAASSPAAVIVFDNFQSDTLGGPPANWTLNTSPATFLVKSEAQSPFPLGDTVDDRGMRLDNDPTKTFEAMQRGFSAQTGTFYLQFEYLPFHLADLHNLQIGNDNVTTANRGVMLTMSNTSGVLANAWYRYTLTIDVAADNYDLRVQSIQNNSLNTYTENIAFFNPQPELDTIRFWFNTGNQVGAGDYALDNILLTDDPNDLNFAVQVPEPSSFALVLLGLLSFWNRRRFPGFHPGGPDSMG